MTAPDYLTVYFDYVTVYFAVEFHANLNRSGNWTRGVRAEIETKAG